MNNTILQDIEKQARERPDHPAIVEASGNHLSYRALWREIRDRGERFEEDGIRPGDLCGFMASDGAEYVATALGIMNAGGGLVPIPESHRSKSNSIYFQNLSLDWLIDENDGFRAREMSEPTERRRMFPGDLELDPAFIRFTSGTTGQRKGVLLGHETIQERTAAANRALQLSPDDRILWLLSMDYHFVVSILTYLKNGSTMLIPEDNLADSVRSFAHEQRATVFYATPYHFRLLNGAGEDGGLDELRLAISTAEEVSRQTVQTFYDRFGQPISQALGVIEVGLPAVNLDAPLEKPDSVGQIVPDYDVTVLDEEGQPVPDGSGEVGELHIDGPGLFDAYLSPWKSREEVCSDDGFPTGDQGWLDADGDLYLEGRRANRINRAGNKFFCEEVERVINRHPGVKESRVYGETHEKLGELPYAEFVPADPEDVPDGSELKDHCKEHMAAYKIPRSFERTGELPRTPTGKIKRT